MAEKTEAKKELEREYVIPLRKNWNKVPRYKRANKAIRTIKEFLVRHMKIRDGDLNKVKIDKYLNEFVWLRGIRKPPARVKVKVKKEGDIVKVELAEITKSLEFKKGKLEKREKAGKKEKTKEDKEEKTPEKPEEQKTEEEKQEEKKEVEEKKSAVIEAGGKMEKAAAKTMKHQTKMSKQPKRQRRMALQK